MKLIEILRAGRMTIIDTITGSHEQFFNGPHVIKYLTDFLLS